MAGMFVKISPLAARMGTLFARQTRGLSFQAVGETWDFAPGGRGDAKYGVVAYGKLGESECTVWLDEPGWKVAAAAVLATPPEDVTALPSALVQAALECLFSDALALLEKAVGLPYSLSRLEVRETPALASSFPFSLTRKDGLVLSGAWTAAGDAWREPMEKALRRLSPPPAALSDSLLMEGIISAGTWRLAAGEVRDLELGDVVLLPGAEAWQVAVGERFLFAAVFERGKLMADGKSMTDAKAPAPAAPVVPAATAAATPAVAAPEAGQLAALDEAEVEMRAEVGRLNVTLAELRRLSIGEVVEFSASVDEPATLVAGGRAVAHGQLVDVGGRVGVRITALAEK